MLSVANPATMQNVAFTFCICFCFFALVMVAHDETREYWQEPCYLRQRVHHTETDLQAYATRAHATLTKSDVAAKERHWPLAIGH